MARGLFDRDDHLRDTLAEAMETQKPYQIRRLFGIILAFCQPVNARELWDFCYCDMVEDLDFQGIMDEQVKINTIISTIKPILLDSGQVIEHVYPELPRYNPTVGQI